MKKSIAIFFLLIAINSFSQVEGTIIQGDKKLKLGFSVGLNYGNLDLKSNDDIRNSFKSMLGIQLGILAEKKISNIAFLSPRIEMNFNRVKLIQEIGTTKTLEQNILPLRIDFMFYFVFRDFHRKFQPYFYAGPNVRTPLKQENQAEIVYRMQPDFAIDFGLGLNKICPHFQFAPEIKYSFGLLNLSKTSTIEKMNFHTLSLVINLKGK